MPLKKYTMNITTEYPVDTHRLILYICYIDDSDIMRLKDRINFPINNLFLKKEH